METRSLTPSSPSNSSSTLTQLLREDLVMTTRETGKTNSPQSTQALFSTQSLPSRALPLTESTLETSYSSPSSKEATSVTRTCSSSIKICERISPLSQNGKTTSVSEPAAHAPSARLKASSSKPSRTSLAFSNNEYNLISLLIYLLKRS